MKFLLLIMSLLFGWRTREKIVVIESDDWGSIRVRDKAAYRRLMAMGYGLENSYYSWDCLETGEDLEHLYSILDKVRDVSGRTACFTANVIVANPDFDKIEREKFRRYYYEPALETFRQSPDRRDVYEKWLQGYRKGYFFPQFHGREHIQWWKWLKALRRDEKEVTDTFKFNMCGLPLKASVNGVSFYSPIYLHPDDLKEQGVVLQDLIQDGIRLFNRFFSFKSLSTVAPNVTWADKTEELLKQNGIRYMQTGMWQYKALPGGKVKRVFRYLGQKSKHGMTYLTRNCFFEPVREPDRHVWKETFNQVRMAFLFRKPAIIGTHRVNFVGSINPKNRESSLRQLFLLLSLIRETWPGVHFLSSPELGYMIEKNIDQIKDIKDKLQDIYPRC